MLVRYFDKWQTGIHIQILRLHETFIAPVFIRVESDANAVLRNYFLKSFNVNIPLLNRVLFGSSLLYSICYVLYLLFRHFEVVDAGLRIFLVVWRQLRKLLLCFVWSNRFIIFLQIHLLFDINLQRNCRQVKLFSFLFLDCSVFCFKYPLRRYWRCAFWVISWFHHRVFLGL